MSLMSLSSRDDDRGDPDDDLSSSDGPYADEADRAAMLRDVGLKGLIERMVRVGGVPESENEDVVQLTLLAAYKARTLPKDRERRIPYVLGIARNKAKDHRRKAARRMHADQRANVVE